MQEPDAQPTGFISSDNHHTSTQPKASKRCTRCLKTKPLHEFYPKGGRKDSQCRGCVLKKKTVDREKERKLRKLETRRRKSDRIIDPYTLQLIEVVEPAQGASAKTIMNEYLEKVIWM